MASKHENKKLFAELTSGDCWRNAVLLIFVMTHFACSKDGPPLDTITIQGKVLHHTTRKGLPRVRVYADYGEPCCGGIARILGSDSTTTDPLGNYKLVIQYFRDSSLYRFMTYLKSSTLANKFYYYSGADIQDYGVVEFDYNQMAAPPTVVKLPDQHVQQCDFSVLPIGVLNISFQEKIGPGEDTVNLQFRRLDNNEVYKDFYGYFNLSQSRFPIPIIEDIKTEIVQTVTNTGGYIKVKKDTITMTKGQRRDWVVEH